MTVLANPSTHIAVHLRINMNYIALLVLLVLLNLLDVTAQMKNVYRTTPRPLPPETYIELNKWTLEHGAKYRQECLEELKSTGRDILKQTEQGNKRRRTSAYFRFIKCNWACYMKKFVAAEEYPLKYKKAMECNDKYLKTNQDICNASVVMWEKCIPLFDQE